MSTKTKAQPKTRPKDAKRSHITPSICWFEIPADNPERAKKFYGSLFGWKIKPFPGMTDYWHIDTGGGDDTPDGGLMKRVHPEQPITNYVAVSSVNESAVKVEKLGGTISSPRRWYRGWATSPSARTQRAHVRAVGTERPRTVTSRHSVDVRSCSFVPWPLERRERHAIHAHVLLR